MFRPALIVLGIALVAAGAALHGRATQRWDALAPAESRSEALHAMAIRYSDYESVDIPSELPIKEKSRVSCRQYTSPQTHETIVVSLTTGIPGSVSTHTPDVCYVGSGYRMTKNPTRQTLDLPGGQTMSYYVAEFEKKRATGVDRQRVRWAWTADGNWDAPSSPRFRYLRAGELVKIYFVTALPETPPASGDSKSSDSAADSPAFRAFMINALAQYSAAWKR